MLQYWADKPSRIDDISISLLSTFSSKRTIYFKQYKEALIYKRLFPGFSIQEIKEKVKIIEEITGKELNFKLIDSKLIILSQKVQ